MNTESFHKEHLSLPIRHPIPLHEAFLSSPAPGWVSDPEFMDYANDMVLVPTGTDSPIQLRAISLTLGNKKKLRGLK